MLHIFPNFVTRKKWIYGILPLFFLRLVFTRPVGKGHLENNCHSFATPVDYTYQQFGVSD